MVKGEHWLPQGPDRPLLTPGHMHAQMHTHMKQVNTVLFKGHILNVNFKFSFRRILYIHLLTNIPVSQRFNHLSLAVYKCLIISCWLLGTPEWKQVDLQIENSARETGGLQQWQTVLFTDKVLGCRFRPSWGTAHKRQRFYIVTHFLGTLCFVFYYWCQGLLLFLNSVS